MKRIQLIEITAIAFRRMSILEYVDLRPQQQEKQLILMEFTEDNITKDAPQLLEMFIFLDETLVFL